MTADIEVPGLGALKEVAVRAMDPMPPKRRKSWWNGQNRFRDAASPQAVIDLCALIQSQAARIAELEGGLRPFAMFAEIADADGQLWTDRSSIAEVMGSALRHTIRYGHLRQARSLLSEEGVQDLGSLRPAGSVPSVQGDEPASHGEVGA